MTPPSIYLLDTNIMVELLRHNTAMQQKVQNATRTFLSSTILGELYFGAFHAKRNIQASVAQVDALAQTYAILACDANTAVLYGEIRQELTAQGQVIPENDMWIAAVARQHGLTLATRDAHFSRVGGLLLEQW